MVYEMGKDLICGALEMWVSGTKKRWPDTQFVTFGEFGDIWRNQDIRPQDKPRLINELDKTEQDLIARFYPQIM